MGRFNEPENTRERIHGLKVELDNLTHQLNPFITDDQLATYFDKEIRIPCLINEFHLLRGSHQTGFSVLKSQVRPLN